MSNEEILRAKAIQLCERCASAGLPQPLYRIVSDYSIDFTFWYEGRSQTLSLYYKPKNQQWTAVPKTDWLRRVVAPVIQPIFEHSSAGLSALPAIESAGPVRAVAREAYFAEALTCLSLLEPFADDNIDFSIICQRTRESVRNILNDSTFSQLDHAALSEALAKPNTPNFWDAKEYLIQCLTLCHISNVVN